MSKEMSKEEKEAALKRREEHKKLSTQILQGIDYREIATVKLVDGGEYEVTVHPLGDGALMRCFQQAGLKLTDIGEKGAGIEDKPYEWMQLLTELIVRGVTVENGERLSMDDVENKFALGERAKLGLMILKLSGIIGEQAAATETFRSQ